MRFSWVTMSILKKIYCSYIQFWKLVIFDCSEIWTRAVIFLVSLKDHSIGRAFNYQSNDPCRALVRSPFRADFSAFSSCPPSSDGQVLFRLGEVKVARKASNLLKLYHMLMKTKDSKSWLPEALKTSVVYFPLFLDY